LPALDRLPHQKAKVVNFLPNDEANAVDHMRTIVSTVELDIKNLPPKTLVRVNAEVGLAHSDKDGQVKDGIWG
jgi:hypothetical protein